MYRVWCLESSHCIVNQVINTPYTDERWVETRQFFIISLIDFLTMGLIIIIDDTTYCSSMGDELRKIKYFQSSITESHSNTDWLTDWLTVHNWNRNISRLGINKDPSLYLDILVCPALSLRTYWEVRDEKCAEGCKKKQISTSNYLYRSLHVNGCQWSKS